MPDAGAGVPPPAPWRLCGDVLIVPALVPLARARALVGARGTVVPVAPGHTLGGVLLGAYGPGSTLCYHELIVLAGLVRSGGRVGLWAADLRVDLEASRRGGREIWALPKQLASFERGTGGEERRTPEGGAAGAPAPLEPQGRIARVVVRGDDRPVVEVRAARPRVRLPLVVLASVLGPLAPVPTWLLAGGALLAGPARARVRVPPDSPLAGLGLRFAPLGLAGRAWMHVPGPRERPRDRGAGAAPR